MSLSEAERGKIEEHWKTYDQRVFLKSWPRKLRLRIQKLDQQLENVRNTQRLVKFIACWKLRKLEAKFSSLKKMRTGNNSNSNPSKVTKDDVNSVIALIIAIQNRCEILEQETSAEDIDTGDHTDSEILINALGAKIDAYKKINKYNTIRKSNSSELEEFLDNSVRDMNTENVQMCKGIRDEGNALISKFMSNPISVVVMIQMWYVIEYWFELSYALCNIVKLSPQMEWA